jgi:hypothetical protein
MMGKIGFGLFAAVVIYAVFIDFVGFGIMLLKLISGEP